MDPPELSQVDQTLKCYSGNDDSRLEFQVNCH